MKKVYVLEIRHYDTYYHEGASVTVFRKQDKAIDEMYKYLREIYYSSMDEDMKAYFDECAAERVQFFEWPCVFDADVWETYLV